MVFALCAVVPDDEMETAVEDNASWSSLEPVQFGCLELLTSQQKVTYAWCCIGSIHRQNWSK